MNDFEWFNSPSRCRQVEFEEEVMDLCHLGLDRTQIAHKLQCPEGRVSYAIKIREEMAAVNTEEKKRGKRPYTVEERTEIINEIVGLYNSGLTAREVADKINKSHNHVERWLNIAREEGVEVRSKMRRKNASGDCKPAGSLAVVDEKNNGADEEAKPLEVITDDNEQIIDAVIETIKTFADSHRLLGKHIDKMFELIDKEK